MNCPAPADMVERARAEYLEMPGLKMTAAQASRLLGLDQETCMCVLDALVREGFLVRASDGRFVCRSLT